VRIFSPKLWLGAVAALSLGLSAQTAQAAYTTDHLLDARGTAHDAPNNNLLSDTGELANNGFKVVNTTTQPAGTGVLDPFLRIQRNGHESGYNTSYGFPLDDKHPEGFTHAIHLGDIPLVTIGGHQYREFLLDVNQVDSENHGSGAISINQIQIFQSAFDVGGSNSDFNLQAASPTDNALLSLTELSAVERFRLNGSSVSATKNIEIWANEGNGSGTADMLFYVDNDAFAAGDSSFITMFSQYGQPNGTYSSLSGFEEWAVRKTDGHGVPLPPPGPAAPGTVPAPAGLVLIASAVPMLAFRRVFRRKMAAN